MQNLVSWDRAHPLSQSIRGRCCAHRWSQAISSISCLFPHPCWWQSSVWLRECVLNTRITHWLKECVLNTHHTLHVRGLLWSSYLKLLTGETAARTAGALDSECCCSLWVTHFQEGGEHAPPGRDSANTQQEPWPGRCSGPNVAQWSSMTDFSSTWAMLSSHTLNIDLTHPPEAACILV